MYRFWYILCMKPILNASFYRSDSGNEPVREWLKSLSASDRKVLGEDIKTVQFGWPLGMPLVRHLEVGIWEIRVKLENRIARVFFVWRGQRWWCCMALSKNSKTPLGKTWIWPKKDSKFWKGSDVAKKHIGSNFDDFLNEKFDVLVQARGDFCTESWTFCEVFFSIKS